MAYKTLNLSLFRVSVVEVARSNIIDTVKPQIIELCAMSLGLPPLVRSGVFFVFFHVAQKG